MKERVSFHAVKEAVSLEEVLRYYQVPGLRRHRQQLQGRCPLHAGSRDDSFRASLTQNVFHCFACQARGSVLDFVAAREKCSLREAALRLQEWFRVPERTAGPRRAETSAVPTVQFGNKKGGNPPLPFTLTGIDYAHPYLRQRGIERATAVQFGVGYYPGPGLMSRRLVIPIPNERGEIVAYAGRALEGQRPKYKLPAGFRKGQELFNVHRAAATGQPTVIVVEGYFDCLRVHQAGFPCVVALMGSSLSPEQKRILLERFERVILLLDGDAVGRAATRCVFRGKAATVPKSSRPPFRNEAGHRFRFQAGHFSPGGRNPGRDHFGTIPQGERRWTTTPAMGFHWKGGGTHIANEKVVHAKAERSPATPIRAGTPVARADRGSHPGRQHSRPAGA
jgi:DNA primase